jgi:hypothetical protein
VNLASVMFGILKASAGPGKDLAREPLRRSGRRLNDALHRLAAAQPGPSGHLSS